MTSVKVSVVMGQKKFNANIVRGTLLELYILVLNETNFVCKNVFDTYKLNRAGLTASSDIIMPPFPFILNPYCSKSSRFGS